MLSIFSGCGVKEHGVLWCVSSMSGGIVPPGVFSVPLVMGILSPVRHGAQSCSFRGAIVLIGSARFPANLAKKSARACPLIAIRGLNSIPYSLNSFDHMATRPFLHFR